MKKLIPILLFISCVATNSHPPVPVPAPKPTPEPVVFDTVHKTTTIIDTVLSIMFVQDTMAIPFSTSLSVKDFGAKCDGVADDFIADSMAFAFAVTHPFMCSTITFPVGTSMVSKPLLLQNNGQFFTIHIKGILPAKEASGPYLSQLYFTNRSGYGLGIQLGRGIIIENLEITGQYKFPYQITGKNIGTFRYNDWTDPTITDSRYSPYAGVCIDPNANASGTSGGTSGVEIRQCLIQQWMVGIMLTPNAYTLNDEMINIIDNSIGICRDAIAIGQDQSKEIHIDRLKVWGACHTVLDGINYGRGTGGGSVDIEGGNFASCINELFNLHTDRFPLSVKDIYAENLFRLGTVGGGAGTNFINLQIDFLEGDGQPEPDFMLVGSANFYGGCLRYYDAQKGHRLNLINFSAMFRDLTLNDIPLIQSLYTTNYPTPIFDNVHLWNSGKTYAANMDTLIRINAPQYLYADSVKWVSTAYSPGLGSIARVGDYITCAPSAGNGNGAYYDRFLNAAGCPTIIIGEVQSISNDTLYMTRVALNAPENKGFDALYLSRIK